MTTTPQRLSSPKCGSVYGEMSQFCHSSGKGYEIPIYKNSQVPLTSLDPTETLGDRLLCIPLLQKMKRRPRAARGHRAHGWRPPLSAAGAYLAVLTNAVHGVLITAELHGVDFPEVGLPAHGALVLLHVWESKTRLSLRPGKASCTAGGPSPSVVAALEDVRIPGRKVLTLPRPPASE